VNISKPKPPSPLRRKPRALLEEILKGHEDFPGYTPDWEMPGEAVRGRTIRAKLWPEIASDTSARCLVSLAVPSPPAFQTTDKILARSSCQLL
jgi:hypothetical protein